MFRVLIVQLLLFVLPFAIFAGYLAVMHRQRLSQGLLAALPVAKLTVAGIILTILGLVALATFGGSDPEGTYSPAVLKDGKIVPGTIK